MGPCLDSPSFPIASHGYRVFTAPRKETQRGSLELHFSVSPIWPAVTLGSFTFQYRVSVPMNSSPALSRTLVTPAPLPELASWASPRPTTHPLDNVAAPSTWDNSTNQTNPSSLPNRQLVPPTTTDTRDAGQTAPTAPTTELTSPHSSHTSSLQTNDLSIDFAIRLIKPRQTKGCTVILPRIETHVYLDIALPSRSWNAIQLLLTKSVTSDDSSSIGEGIKPLLLLIIVRGATTRQERSRVCEKCEKRMGNMTGSPSMIDSHGPSNILTSKLGMVQVHFTFSCYSRHHVKEDEQYLYVAVAE